MTVGAAGKPRIRPVSADVLCDLDEGQNLRLRYGSFPVLAFDNPEDLKPGDRGPDDHIYLMLSTRTFERLLDSRVATHSPEEASNSFQVLHASQDRRRDASATKGALECTNAFPRTSY